MSTTLITGPTVEPVTLAEVQKHLRVTDAGEDTLLNSLITAARQYTEKYTSRALVSQTWDMHADTFPPDGRGILFPVPPLISVVSVSYVDIAQATQVWAASKYVVDTDPIQGLLYPAYGEVYPSTLVYPKSVTLQFVAGYEDSGSSPVDLTDNIPTPIKQALLLLIGHFYENREVTTQFTDMKYVPLSYAALLSPYKIQGF